jgi:threonyl-tRNA synthetase
MNVKVQFPDNSVKEFSKGTTIMQVAESISPSLAKKAVCARLNDKLVDTSFTITQDCSLSIITNDKQTPELLEVLRHSCAHLLAQAVKELFGDKVQVTIGPVIENGFYYDFASQFPFSVEMLPQIEQKMQEIANRKIPVLRSVKSRNDAVDFFRKIGEEYKAKIIEQIPESEELSLYSQGEFTDLCRGPHIPNTAFLKHFKLMKVSGAYWKGDSKNEMLQRVYGTCWHTKEALDEYIKQIEEAEKRDHRKIGKQLNLFHQQDEAPGDVFWHEKGAVIYKIIEDYIYQKLQENGYIQVRTPQLVSRKLWEMSGHWENYRPNMFTSRVDDEDMDFAIKPMNCPCHVQIFNNQLRSYKELPIRMAEFGKCHRYEPSGALHGLMRVRAFTQDDAHIFCTEEQILEETVSFYKLLKEVYNKFGFTNVEVKFSDRPEKRAGDDSTWDLAEESLKKALEYCGEEYIINKGEGAFYGPKLEFQIKDAIGRKWQCGTLQLDFVLPQRLDATYISESGEKKFSVMLHRAILGSFERFIAIAIENYAGNFPLWLAPVQVVVLGVSNDFDTQVQSLTSKLKEKGVRAISDTSSETVSYKIRKHSEQKVPYIVTIGKKEIENGSISARKFGEEKTTTFNSFEEFMNKFS